MGLRARLSRRVLIIAAIAVVLLAGGAAAAAALAGGTASYRARDVRIAVLDGPGDNEHVVIDATFFTPAGTGRVPAILLAHGFGETKEAVAGQAAGLARAGFAVLTWSARGFGRSTGQIALDSPAYEVKDVEQLVSWLARQPRVLLDHPGDPRVGIAGASYGGAIVLLTAGYDARIDAVVPEITWNDLATALFPNAAGGPPVGGVFKKEWAGLLFTQGTAGFGDIGLGAAGAGGPGGAAGAGAGAGGAGAGGGAGSAGAGGGASGAGAGAGGSGGTAGVAAGAPGSAALAQAAACGRFLPSICAMYLRIATIGRATPQAIAILRAASPATVASRIHAPTLLIQGENDSLFGLDQAAATYQDIRGNGTPADMVWFAGGHDGGNQEATRIDALAIGWFDRWLSRPWRSGARAGGPAGAGAAGGPAGSGSGDQSQPGFSVSRNLGFDPSTGDQSLGIATAPVFPGLGGTRPVLVKLAGPAQPVISPPGGSPPAVSAFPGLTALGSAAGLSFCYDLPGQSAAFLSAPLTAPLQVTGAPTVRIAVSGPAGLTLFAKIYDIDQAGNRTLPFSLAAPLRVEQPSASRELRIRLPAIDYEFAAGHRIALVLASTDFGYATSADPAVYQVALAGQGVTMPTDPSLVLLGSGLAWWTWAAPIAAVAAAALLLLTGRRWPAGGPAPGEAGVPLDITGLTKRYRDGQLAVDDLDLRAERGQIVGLLGPNGAGKTTTLRALMGLIHPDAGTITIFGRHVRAGSSALSRLGAFVEGPGFLPHLSGRANLELYWQANGRSAADPHLPEVLAIAGLGSAIDRPVRSYSRGMSQRLAIAQAMLGLPDLLVLDEPLNGLDPPQITQMREVLTGYAAAGRTVVLSSHLLAEVEQTCTHVVVMRDGRGIAAGPVSEIAGGQGSLLIGTPEPARAASVLGSLPGIGEVTERPDGVHVHPGAVATAAVVACLVRAGIPVELVTPSRRLEDAFLELIGPAGSPHGFEPAEVAR
jgi:ABC-2 type transport system ATP-binding protein